MQYLSFNKRFLSLAIACSVVGTIACSMAGTAGAFQAVPTDEKSSETDRMVASERFDHEVREDFFAGFQGDEEALNRAMETCKAVLEKEPEHAEAMVWLGAGEMYLSGEKFSAGNVAVGMKLWTSSIEKLDKAEELEPDNVARSTQCAADDGETTSGESAEEL